MNRLKFTLHDSRDKVNSNILLLLHGYGDTSDNFKNFGLKMQLPQTAIGEIIGPLPIPFLDSGNGWLPLFDEFGNEICNSDLQFQLQLQKTRQSLLQLLKERILLSESNPKGWAAERIFLLGFSQGGSVALDLAFHFEHRLGGVVSISGWIEKEAYKEQLNRTSATSVCITQGTKDETVSNFDISEKQQLIAKIFSNNQIHLIAGKGHQMPQSKDEMRHIMSFFGSNLWLRNLALESMADVYPIN